MSERFRCDVCGRFIGLADLSVGYAVRRLLTPDSHFSAEEYETLCQDHKWQRYPRGEFAAPGVQQLADAGLIGHGQTADVSSAGKRQAD